MDFYEIGCCAGEDDEELTGADVESPEEMVRAQIRQLRLAAASQRMQGDAAKGAEFDAHADTLEDELKKMQHPVAKKTITKKKPGVKKKPAAKPGTPSLSMSKNIDDSGEYSSGTIGLAVLLAALGIGYVASKKSRLKSA